MHNPWKAVTLGILALGAIVGTSTLTTAYLLRPPASQPEMILPAAPSSPEPRAAVVRVAPASTSTPGMRGAAHATPVLARPTPSAPAAELTPATPSAAVIAPAAPAPLPSAPAAAAATVPSAATAADCDTGGDRAARIAKPGALGALLGAGLGAAGGGIAKGGKGAGQGALIGGIAGAAIGAGYGAYKTKTECGTVFGEASAASERAR